MITGTNDDVREPGGKAPDGAGKIVAFLRRSRQAGPVFFLDRAG